MMDSIKRSKKYMENRNRSVYDTGVMKVIIFASLLIILSTFIIGSISYTVAKNAVIRKLKSKDIVYIAESISSKIDGRIERAKETSVILAEDPTLLKWVKNGEKDEFLGNLAKEKITDIAENFDYDNTFIVSSGTNHYWSEKGELIDIMSENDPDDSWFFETISSKEPISIVIDYNNERKDTFVFVNALMGDRDNPLAVTGVGLNLEDITAEFEGYKFGHKSNMWLIDKNGKIYISEDLEQISQNIGDFIPPNISDVITGSITSKNLKSNILEYENSKDGETYDLIYKSIKSTDWKLVFQIPRSESISVLQSIKINIMAASFITIILIVIVFYLISNKIANPYKIALALNQELEIKVNERTLALQEINTKIMDSIEYAKMIQEAMLPSQEELRKVFDEYFLIWKPRDLVGGDFYWVRRFHHHNLIAVGDCTGHGVPAALMTMAVNSILNHIVDEICNDNPALILKELNRIIKETIHGNGLYNGLDIGIISVSRDQYMIFAGAKTSLYINSNEGLNRIKGDGRSIGYGDKDVKYEFTNHNISFDHGKKFYITTDGYVDQNGGEKDYPFGKKRFEKIISSHYNIPFTKQKLIFEKELKEYMNGEMQRDDITVLGFKPYMEM